jgi:hypothetical protein
MSIWQSFLALLARAAAPPAEAAPLPMPVAAVGDAPRSRDVLTLTHADYVAAATRLGCEVAAIKAVAEVESAGRAFLADGRPPILFEAHVFHRLTKGRHVGARDRRGVPLSVAKWDSSLYGRAGTAQYDRLADAAKLDEKAAVMACSWGQFQVMGFNFAALGFPDVDTLVEFMDATDTAREHLDLFVRFILLHDLDGELRERRWADFARQYNGPGFAANRYDVKMAAAYKRHLGA